MALSSDSNPDRTRNSRPNPTQRRAEAQRSRRSDDEVEELADVFESDDDDLGIKNKSSKSKKSSKGKQKNQPSQGKRVLMLCIGGVAFIVSFVLVFSLIGYLRKRSQTPQFSNSPAHISQENVPVTPPDWKLPSQPNGQSPNPVPSTGTPSKSSGTPSSSASESQTHDAELMAQPKIKDLMAKPAPGAVITTETPLKPGLVLVTERSGNRWRPVTVLDVLPNGDVKIHYINWADSWDEIVKRQALRFPPDESINANR